MNQGKFLRSVIIRACSLFVVINLAFASIAIPWGKISFYNHIFPGRERLPYGENPAESYNLSVFDLNAMFLSHEISAPKPTNEYRVVLIGDSALWGWMLRPEQTLAGRINSSGVTSCDGRRVRAYNLGYPTISLTKDLLILNSAMQYHPDMIIWLFTLEAFPNDKQLTPPLVQNNAFEVQRLISQYHLPFDPEDPQFVKNYFWDKTIIGQRRYLADLIRLQMYGILWSATGIDQAYPDHFEQAQTDFSTDTTFHDNAPPTLESTGLAFQVLLAGKETARRTPLLYVNEPMLISTGTNSDIRYNYFYPRWAYDQYRKQLSDLLDNTSANYLDLWDLVPASEFTNTPFHMTPNGESILADRIQLSINSQVCP